MPYNTTLDEMDEFNDSHVVHTAQLFFYAMLYDQLAIRQPYIQDVTERTLNSQDRVYAADPTAVLVIDQDELTSANGLIASITAVVDPNSTPEPGV